jgi:hypothetical protein
MKHLTLMCAGTGKRLHACSQETSMSCTVLVLAKHGASKPMVAHTFDTAGGTDFRLVKVVRERARARLLYCECARA